MAMMDEIVWAVDEMDLCFERQTKVNNIFYKESFTFKKTILNYSKKNIILQIK